MRPYNWAVLSRLITPLVVRPGNTAAFTPQDAPYQSQPGQSGYNQCGTGYNQFSECQNVYLNTIEDFCLWAPPYPGFTIGDTEQTQVAWCTKSGYGTRLIPDGSITGVHLVLTPDYIQITGVGDLTNINILTGDQGGEMDYHGAAGAGFPVGGLLFSSAFGQLQQMQEWTGFISYDMFCLRACVSSAESSTLCQYNYPVMGCEWNMPGNYSEGIFESCVGDSAEPMGIYGTSTFSLGQPQTPSAHLPPPSSSCTFYSTISNGQNVLPMPTESPGTVTRVREPVSPNIPTFSAPTSSGLAVQSMSFESSSSPLSSSLPVSGSLSPGLSHSRSSPSSPLSPIPETSSALSSTIGSSSSHMQTTSTSEFMPPSQVSASSSTPATPNLSSITSSPVLSSSPPQCPPGYLTRAVLATGGASVNAWCAICEKLALVGLSAVAVPLICDLMI